MIIKTTYPLRVNRFIDSSNDYYSNIDAKNVQEVKAFQDWLDAKYPSGWATYSNGKKYVVGGKKANGYGNYGKSTTAAYITDGAEWEKTRTKKDEPKKDETKKDETKKDETKKDETKKDETKKDETKKDETKKDETKKDETKKDETKKDETKKDEITVTKDDKGNTITVTKRADGTTLTVITDKNGKEISKKESGMSKKLKIGLIIGGSVLVLGIIIFAVTRNRGK